VTNQDPPQSTLTLLLGIWGHLPRRRRVQLGLLLVVMLASAIAELLSLGSVLPFLAVLSDPELLWKYTIVQDVSNKLGLTSANQLLIPGTLTFALTAVLAALVRLSNLWLNLRLAAAIGSDLSCEAYRRTLYQPYAVHVQRNSSSVITSTTVHIGQTVAALNALLQLITSALVAGGLLLGLLVIDAPVALGAAALFGTAYGVLAITSRRQLLINSQKIAEASSQQLKALQEGLGAIRDVLLEGNQPTYLQIYRQADRPQRQLQAKNVFFGTFPRYAIEAVGIIGIALLGGLLVLQRGSDAAVIPLLGALALGAQRLLPALQQVYSGWSTLTGCNTAMRAVLTMLSQPLPPQVQDVQPLTLLQSVGLESVYFTYGQDQPKVLHGLNLHICRGERIGLIGSTGSGKSTTVDLLMGLLKPTTGRILVDGVDLHDPKHPERLSAWRASIAHVPQVVYLADSSVAENIAFGVPRQHIDLDLVKQAAAQAQIASFIESNPEGYESFVGERGIRLSGGQRQRIGIARALYKKAEVLILDEATSALDSRTEETVMHAINALSESLTVIMIAHRLSTVENCDRVIRLEQGSVSADGPPRLVLATQD
jgi:ABC-type multidrug transport system fused ATPase/permease subunit